MSQRAAQVPRLRDRVVVEEVNQFAAGGAQGDVALDRRLFAARDEDFQPILGIIELTRGCHGQDLVLTRLGRDDNGHQRQRVAHEANLSGVKGMGKEEKKLQIQSSKLKRGFKLQASSSKTVKRWTSSL